MTATLGEPAPAKSTEREFDIDPFRGFVCICLIMLHFFTLGLYEYWMRMGGATLETIIWNVRLGVESFFVLAGLMMAHMLRPAPGEEVSLGLYLKRRFFRLLLPYWAAVLLATADRWAVYLAFKAGANDLPTFVDVMAQLLLLQEFLPLVGRPPHGAAEGYWSMVTLEQFYLLWLGCYGLVRWLVPANKTTKIYGNREWAMALLTLLGGLASAAVISGYLSPKMIIDGKEIHIYLAEFGFYLVLGMLLYWAIRQKYEVWMFGIAAAVLIGLAIFQNEPHVRPIKGLIAVTILALLVRGYRLPKWQVMRWLAFVGQRSYSFYLMHAIVGFRVFSFAGRLSGRGDWIAFPLLAVALVLTFVVSVLFFKYVEAPCRELARGVRFRRAAV